LLAAGMVLGGFAGAQAVEWRAKGGWDMSFGYFSGTTFSKHTAETQRSDPRIDGIERRKQYGSGNGRDSFVSAQRTNFHVEAVANEYLLGKVQFEMGAYNWGEQGTTGTRSAGGSMGQRGASVGVRESYLDFFMPGSAFRLRMGIQTFWNPSYTFTPMVLAQQLPGIVASFKASDEVSVTAFWLRPYNENFTGVGANADDGRPAAVNRSFMDNFDIFGVSVPLAFDGLKVTPWGMYAQIGSNWDKYTPQSGANRVTQVRQGLNPHYWTTMNWKGNDKYANSNKASYSTAYWVGLTGDVTMADPLRIAWDMNYGTKTNSDYGFLDRSGWIVNLLVEYKMDFGIPGLALWYGSGDDGSTANGSEQMPVIDVNDPNSSLSSFGNNGSPTWGGNYDGIMGLNMMAGTWGIGLRLRDMSFVDKLKHTLRLNMYNGTNDPKMAKYMTGKKERAYINSGGGGYSSSNSSWSGADFNTNAANGLYLTTLDYAFEINFDTEYKIYDNLSMFVELGYINLDLSSKAWGAWGDPNNGPSGRKVNTTDAIKAALLFRYTF